MMLIPYLLLFAVLSLKSALIDLNVLRGNKNQFKLICLDTLLTISIVLGFIGIMGLNLYSISVAAGLICFVNRFLQYNSGWMKITDVATQAGQFMFEVLLVSGVNLSILLLILSEVKQ